MIQGILERISLFPQCSKFYEGWFTAIAVRSDNNFKYLCPVYFGTVEFILIMGPWLKVFEDHNVKASQLWGEIYGSLSF